MVQATSNSDAQEPRSRERRGGMAYTKTASLQPKPQKRLKNSGAVVGRDRLLWRRAGKTLRFIGKIL